MLMSVGVIIAALVIYIWPSMWFFDPICTYLFSVIVLATTLNVSRDCMHILMEGSPESVDVEALERDIWALNTENDIVDLHDVHVWSISRNKLAMTAHLKSHKPLKTLSEVTELMRTKYGLFHTSIQVEGAGEGHHDFECENDMH